MEGRKEGRFKERPGKEGLKSRYFLGGTAWDLDMSHPHMATWLEAREI